VSTTQSKTYLFLIKKNMVSLLKYGDGSNKLRIIVN